MNKNKDLLNQLYDYISRIYAENSLNNIEILYQKIKEIHEKLEQDKVGYDTSKLGCTYYYIGNILQQQNKYYQLAVDCYQKAIKSSDSLNSALNENHLGNVYTGLMLISESEEKRKEYYQQAEEVYSKISSENAIQYATAQNALGNLNVNMGNILQQQNKYYQRAVDCYQKAIKSSDSLNSALNENNLGNVYAGLMLISESEEKRKEYYQQAEEVYSKISFENAIQYATAQNALGNLNVNMGNILQQQNKYYQRAVDCYQKAIKSSDSLNSALNENNLGNVYAGLMLISESEEKRKEYYQQAEEVYSKISPEHVIQYATAQNALGNLNVNMGDILKEKDDKQRVNYYQKAITFYEKIMPEINRGQWLESLSNRLSVEEKLFDYSRQDNKSSKQILELIQLNLNNPNADNRHFLNIKNRIYSCNNIKNESKTLLGRISACVLEILRKLWVSNEKNIAHYTDLTTSKILLAVLDKKESNSAIPKSCFRLNTIQQMNDLKEGTLLNTFIGLRNEKESTGVPFIASFTLHHDSLNHFRLYGKESGEEASGVSLVLNKTFFNTYHNTSSVDKLLSQKQENDVQLKFTATQKNIQSTQERVNCIGDKSLSQKLPLYRCIYLDPDSGFLKIAHREEWSFYREIVETNIKDKTKNTDLIREKGEAKETWEKYLNGIVKIEEKIEKELQILTDHITRIQASLKSDTMEDKEIFIIEQILAEILLPLRFLIKHISFREEQECRILRIVDPKDSAIQYHSQINRLYLEYEPYILEHLEKIYLAPRATNQKEIYEHLCIDGRKNLKIKQDNDVRVKISQHPFR